MVEYCPNCNAQLPPGLEKCPACGHPLHSRGNAEFTGRDIFWLSFTTLGVVLVPLLIIIGIVWLIIAFLK